MIDYLFNNSGYYEIPSDFVLKRKKKIRELKKMQFSLNPQYEASAHKAIASEIKKSNSKIRKVLSEDKHSVDMPKSNN